MIVLFCDYFLFDYNLDYNFRLEKRQQSRLEFWLQK